MGTRDVHRFRSFSVVPPGLVPVSCAYPALARWAAFFRRFAAGGNAGTDGTLTAYFHRCPGNRKMGNVPSVLGSPGIVRIHFRGYTGPATSIEIAYFAPVTGPMTKMVLPDGSSKSNVLAPHSSSFGGRKTSTFELHSR